ncbi:MAG: hypothetical protein EOO92_13105 [Pedobacter sp.]|nr:MAG: hypothetical protein EOO92_13105 [Pedobacter sp.]
MEISTLMTEICLLKPTLEMFVLRYPINEEQADQLVQDTLISALLKADTYNETMTLKHWLLSLMKDKYNEVYDQKLNVKDSPEEDRVVNMKVVYVNTVTTVSDRLDVFEHDLILHEQEQLAQEAQVKGA